MTSYIEQQNLMLRMQHRRLARLTHAFSRKFANRETAVSLYVAHTNLYRVHGALRVTPTMQLGVTDPIWSIEELVEAASSGENSGPVGRRVGGFTAINGGKADWKVLFS